MPSLSSHIQRLLHNHSKFVDFLSASLIISLCLILLLPKVHDSFAEADDHDHLDDHNNSSQLEHLNQQLPHDIGDETNLSISAFSSHEQVVANNINNNHDDNEGPPHQHHHDHKLPLGELIICIGFFVFYCIGLGLSKSSSNDLEPLLSRERKASTVCCSSTRCPSSREQETLFMPTTSATDDSRTGKAQEELAGGLGGSLAHSTELDGGCVFTLNKHHNHHTHNRHHEHQPPPNSQPNPSGKKGDNNSYGSITRAQTELGADQQDSHDPTGSGANRKRANQIYVEEISITRRVRHDQMPGWPLSIKVTLFSLLLIAALVVFDMNIHGLIESLKVFRAAATGALLYVAFFLVLPRSSAGCNSCSKEEC